MACLVAEHAFATWCTIAGTFLGRYLTGIARFANALACFVLIVAWTAREALCGRTIFYKVTRVTVLTISLADGAKLPRRTGYTGALGIIHCPASLACAHS